jgi:hypothetical protein
MVFDRAHNQERQGMRLQLALMAAAVLAAGPLAAQGTFSPGRKPGSGVGSGAPSDTYKPKPYLPAPSTPPSRPTSPSAPEAPKAPGFEPYRPFSGSSVYSRPDGAPRQDPCKTSVYVNACGKN